jgi:hypothetical protein
MDFRGAGHLPNQRSDRQPASPDRLPRQRNGITPQMHGRYPDYNVLDAAGHWDAATRAVVSGRLDPLPPLRVFSTEQAAALHAFCDCVMAQDREPRIPVLAMIDAKLHAGQGEGYRYAELPEDVATWKGVAAGLDAAARERGADDFASAEHEVQHDVIDAFQGARLTGSPWDELPPARAWSVVMRDVLSAFYSHPWAWNEIGYGGPAYPRGYARLGAGQREHWEAAAALDPDPVADTRERHVEGT